MTEIAADPPASSCNRLYPRPRFQEFQSLEPDPFAKRPRATRAGVSQREAPAIRAGGRAAFPIQGGACPISRLGSWARRRCRICSTASRICCGSSPRNSCRRRSLPSTRQRVSGSICRRCGRSRIFDRCWPPFWQPLRAATSPPPRPRISQSGWMPACARRGASRAALKAQIATTTQPRALNLAATSVRSERSRTANYPLEFDRGGCYMSAMVRHDAWILRITGPVLV